MKTYTIRPGQWNFNPLESWFPRRARGFMGSVIFDSSAWWSIDDWQGDRDIFDANKLKGLTCYFSANNYNSAMIAWRPGSKDNVFEVFAYTNYPGSEWKTGPIVKVEAGQKLHFQARIDRKQVAYNIEEKKITHPFRRCWFYREVGTSIGGADNSPGPYGGKATQEMKIYVNFKIL